MTDTWSGTEMCSALSTFKAATACTSEVATIAVGSAAAINCAAATMPLSMSILVASTRLTCEMSRPAAVIASGSQQAAHVDKTRRPDQRRKAVAHLVQAQDRAGLTPRRYADALGAECDPFEQHQQSDGRR